MNQSSYYLQVELFFYCMEKLSKTIARLYEGCNKKHTDLMQLVKDMKCKGKLQMERRIFRPH